LLENREIGKCIVLRKNGGASTIRQLEVKSRKRPGLPQPIESRKSSPEKGSPPACDRSKGKKSDTGVNIEKKVQTRI